MDFISEWRSVAPWPHAYQVEQDLVISRALIQLFSNTLLHESLALRGGTALYKLHLTPARYSEDIDLVQTTAEPAGPMMEAIRGILDPWLGKPRYKQTEGRVTFVYRFQSADVPPHSLRLKVETNTREHFSVFGLSEVSFSMKSRWFEGSCSIQSYALDELLGTKMRALYQRKQGRDLFDLAIALGSGKADAGRVVKAFLHYMQHEKHEVSRAEFEKNLALKMTDGEFLRDISPLLSGGYQWEPKPEAKIVDEQLIARLPGDPWKGESK